MTFEGLDGSGKSTQLALAVGWLRLHGRDPLVTHEPGGTPLGETLRNLVLRDSSSPPADAVVELLLILASRRQHVVEVLEPALAAGRLVLCDRFSDSSHAYQGHGRGLGDELVGTADRIATGGLVPDLTFLFDLPPALSRSRRIGAQREADRLESQAESFHHRVRAGFLERAAAEPGRVVVLDASPGPEAVAGVVQQHLAKLVGL